jgi:hypothetical protein
MLGRIQGRARIIVSKQCVQSATSSGFLWRLRSTAGHYLRRITKSAQSSLIDLGIRCISTIPS